MLSTVESGIFARPLEGVSWSCECPHFPFQNRPAWGSDSLSRKGPQTLDIEAPSPGGKLKKISLLGVFAFLDPAVKVGDLMATLILMNGDRMAGSVQLLAGRHLVDAHETAPVRRSAGDGTGLETMGEATINGAKCRVDLFSIDIDSEVDLTRIRFKNLGAGAHFLIFDAFFHFETAKGCPFHSASGGISLSELGSLVRVGDRVQFTKALNQLEKGILAAEDLDEARGEALTFIAIVTAATLETGGSRAMHRVQLEAARKLDSLKTKKEIASSARAYSESVAEQLMSPVLSPSGHLIDRALSLVGRNFAKPLTDGDMARELGLSTSHFRFLFREATGQPFHKYLNATRLEKARRMLLELDMPVSDIADAVGFGGLAHFSRAFAQRFGVSPSSVRRQGRAAG